MATNQNIIIWSGLWPNKRLQADLRQLRRALGRQRAEVNLRNDPYHPPESELGIVRSTKRSIFWKIYFFAVTALSLLGYAMVMGEPGAGVVEVIALISIIIFSVGFFGFCFSIKILRPKFWLYCLIFNLVYFVLYYFITSVDMRAGFEEGEYIIYQLIGWGITMPSYIGLYLYSRPAYSLWASA